MPPFEFRPYDSPLTGSIAELMGAPARAQAEAARANADARARQMQQRGQTNAALFGSIGDIARGGMAAFADQRQQGAAQQQEKQLEAWLSDRLSRADAPPPSAQELIGAGFKPERAMVLLKGFQELGKADLADETRTMAKVGDRLRWIRALPGGTERKQEAWAAMRQNVVGLGLPATMISERYSDEEIDALLQGVGQKPYEAPKGPEGFTLTEGATRFDAAGRPIASVAKPAPEPQRSPIYREYQDAKAEGYTGTFEQFQTADANRKRTAAGSQGGGNPYFTYQTTFDPQGRPTGAIRFDARGGPPKFVDVSAMTGGGQLRQPPGTLGQDSIRNDAALDQLDRLVTMFNQGAKNDIGPAEGRARAIGQNVPLLPTSERFSNFAAASEAFKNATIKAITGAQMSEPEAKRIVGQIPLVTDKPMVWVAKALQTKQNLQDIENRIKTARPDGAQPQA